jgi:transposase-like protein
MAATQKAPNYSDEQTQQLVALYEEHGNDGLEAIAEQLGRSLRSVRSKLVREGVYVAPEKGQKASAKKEGPTKKEMLNELEALVEFPVDGLMGATKEAIGFLIEAFTPEAEAEAETVTED